MLVVGMVIGAFVFGTVAAGAAKKYDHRPFSGVMTGTTTSQVGPSGDEVDSTSTGNIQATHIGNGSYTLVTNQDYARHEEEEHPNGNCAFVEDGTGTGLVITAANGDKINGAIDDDRSVTCAPDTQVGVPVPGDKYYTTLYINIRGGTGRFTDASGWLFVEGTSTLTSLNATGAGSSNDSSTILGDISY